MPPANAEQSLPRGRWIFASFVGCALVGGAVGAVTAYLTYTPSDAPLDFGGRRLAVEVFGVLGLLIGVVVAYGTSLVFVIYRERRQRRGETVDR